LWDFANRLPLGPALAAHKGAVLALSFKPDGTVFATGGQDDKIVLWDATTRQPLGNLLLGQEGEVHDLAFTRDGKTLVSGGADGKLILWDVDLASWKSRACQIANRNLSPREWQRFFPREARGKTCPALPLTDTEFPVWGGISGRRDYTSSTGYIF
jgi:WD40 repeat protein